MEAFLLASLPDVKEAVREHFKTALTSVYLVGEVEFKTDRGKTYVFDFMLITWRGNPNIVLYDRDGDLESLNVGIARDTDGDGDLLLIGGDFNNQSFDVFKRKGTEP